MKRKLGRTSVELFEVGLGSMPLSIRGRPDEQDAISVIHAALELGVNFIDTANVYCLDDSDIGHNERLIAKALKKWSKNGDIFVATKGGLARPGGEWVTSGHPNALRKACENSLVALDVDAIFLYQLHAPDDKVPFADSVGELARLKNEGKIRHIGLSNVSASELNRAQEIVRIESVQNKLNPACQRDLQNGVLKSCSEQGVTYIAYSPVGGGGGRYELASNPLLQELAQKYDGSAYQIMLAWALSRGDHVLVIPGASKPQSIKSSVAASKLVIDNQDFDKISNLELLA